MTLFNYAIFYVNDAMQEPLKFQKNAHIHQYYFQLLMNVKQKKCICRTHSIISKFTFIYGIIYIKLTLVILMKYLTELNNIIGKFMFEIIKSVYLFNMLSYITFFILN